MSSGSARSLPREPNTATRKSDAQAQNETGWRNSSGSGGRNSSGSGSYSAPGETGVRTSTGSGRSPAPGETGARTSTGSGGSSAPGETRISIPAEPTGLPPGPDAPATTTSNPSLEKEGLESPPAKQQRPPGGKPRKRSPALCCCDLQSAVTTMGSVDALIAFILVIVFLSVAPREGALGQKVFLFKTFGFVSSLLFFILGVVLMAAGINRSKVMCWSFVIANGLLFIGSVVPYFIFFYNLEPHPDFSIPFLLACALIYKIYESVCVIFFSMEDPPPPILRTEILYLTAGGDRVIPVVYSPGGLGYGGYGYYGRPYGGYYGGYYPGYALGTGMALGAMSHALYC